MTRANAARLAAATRINTTMASRTINTDIPKLNCTIWVDMVNLIKCSFNKCTQDLDKIIVLTARPLPPNE